MLARLTIDDVRPRTPSGSAAKATVGERVPVSCDVYRDGHDAVTSRVAWRAVGAKDWSTAPLEDAGNDRWEGWFEPTTIGAHEFRVEAWTDRPATWAHNVGIKVAAGQPIDVEVEEGALLLERLATSASRAERSALRAAAAELRASGDPSAASVDVLMHASATPDPRDFTPSDRFALWVDRDVARVGAWYEMFPRSEGGLARAAKHLPAIADMGFDVVYLPPIHPIGQSHRKGRDNSLVARDDDPGSPWAIGSADGGHTAVAPEIGTIDDFDAFVSEATANGLEVALDYALQCSPDHPWVREHAEWFQHRPDGTIKFAENPPKKYQDIVPIEFWPERDGDRKALWSACRAILEHWLGHGVSIFRVDNPHTKPMAFWEWLLADVRVAHPEAVFLAEAFTRPKVMARLAEVGFSQSYTYFTWRTERWELEQYVEELAHGPTADYMRPAFWPNTPDILAGPLRDGSPAAFQLRLVLAALLAPTYGIYSGYELCENQPASPDNEEYSRSEKYELKQRDWTAPGSLAGYVTKLNEIRRDHRAFRELRTVHFHETGNEQIIAWSKTAPDGSDPVLCIVNLDPAHPHEATLSLDLTVLGVDWTAPFVVRDELDGESYQWSSAHPYVLLDPGLRVAHVLAVQP
ncbi:MAG: maltotransferase domain-containing protein [Acidimicrobiales bacterium]